MKIKSFALSFLIMVAMGLSTHVFASDVASWTGKSFKFYITNTTTQSLKIAPAWEGGGEIPIFSFPQGDVVEPLATKYFLVAAPYVETSVLGTLVTSLFVKDTLTEVCSSQILIGENINNTFTISDYPNDGLFVATKYSGTACSGRPVDFTDGTIRLVADRLS